MKKIHEELLNKFFRCILSMLQVESGGNLPLSVTTKVISLVTQIKMFVISHPDSHFLIVVVDESNLEISSLGFHNFREKQDKEFTQWVLIVDHTLQNMKAYKSTILGDQVYNIESSCKFI